MFAGLNSEAYDRTYSDRELVRRVARYLGHERRRVIGAGVLIALLAVVTAVQSLVVAAGINLLDQNPDPVLLVGIVGLSLVTGLVIWWASWLRRRLLGRVTGTVMADLASTRSKP